MRLADKVAIVTGGAHGIGLAIARRYVAEGARVVIADVDAAAGAAETKALGTHCRFVAADVGDGRAVDNLIEQTIAAFGHLDILVNNAGIIHAADFLDLTESDFDRVLRVNLKGAFLTGQAAAPTHGRASQGRALTRRHRQHELDQRGWWRSPTRRRTASRRAALINSPR